MPLGKGFIRRFTQSPRATVRKSCTIRLVRNDNADCSTTEPRTLNSRERKLFSVFNAIWIGVDADGFDAWRIALSDGKDVNSVIDAMRRLGFPALCGPFYGNGEVLGFAGSGPELAKGKKNAVRRTIVQLDDRQGNPLLFLNHLLGEGNALAFLRDISLINIPTIHESWGDAIGPLLSPLETPHSLWVKLCTKYYWFGAAYTFWEAYKSTLTGSERKAGDWKWHEWIKIHSKGLPTFAGAVKPSRSYGPIIGNGPEAMRKNAETCKNRAGLDLAPVADYGPTEPVRLSYLGLQTCYMGLGI